MDLQNIFVIVLAILTLALFIQNIFLMKKYKSIFKNSKGGSLEDVLADQIRKTDKMENEIRKLLQNILQIGEDFKTAIQKIGIKRYSPFKEVGSDQSFTISLLDGNNDGLMITGLHMREDMKTYAKPIEKGVSKYPLSKEEENILKELTK